MRSHAYETLIVPAAQALTMFAVSPFAPSAKAVFAAMAEADIFRTSCSSVRPCSRPV